MVNQTPTSPSALRSRLVRRIGDGLLLVPALLLVLIEQVFWRSARRLLEALGRLPALARLRGWVERLPAWAALPLFLIPEFFDHLGGFWATILLVRGHLVSATIVAVFVKGGAILIAVAIYQACEPTLLRVRWFARLHGATLRARDWLMIRVAPLRAALHEAWRRFQARLPMGSIGRRFRRLRARLASQFSQNRS